MQNKHNIELEYAGLTDTGKVRTNNEDLWICRTIWGEDNIIAAVIDGIGGYKGGEVAAQIASTELISYLEKYPNGERAQLLKEAMVHANNCIYNERKSSVQYSNMGCVMTAILIDTDKEVLYMAHVGDTRLYEFAGNSLTKLSHDQSPIGKYEELGILTEKEAMEHPMRNVIERDLGKKLLNNAIENYIETNTFPLTENTTYLLCSDGLTDTVNSLQLSYILSNDEVLDKKAEQLIYAANEAGGKDNVTVILIHVRKRKNTSTEIKIIENECFSINDNLNSDYTTSNCESNIKTKIKTKKIKSKNKNFITQTLYCLISFTIGWLSQLWYSNYHEKGDVVVPHIPIIQDINPTNLEIKNKDSLLQIKDTLRPIQTLTTTFFPNY